MTFCRIIVRMESSIAMTSPYTLLPAAFFITLHCVSIVLSSGVYGRKYSIRSPSHPLMYCLTFADLCRAALSANIRTRPNLFCTLLRRPMNTSVLHVVEHEIEPAIARNPEHVPSFPGRDRRRVPCRALFMPSVPGLVASSSL